MASAFDLLPAIDLRGGRAVRLEQGDFERETAFSDDPVQVARDFAAAGARWLHVVDLDGARAGVPVHGEVVGGIIEAVGSQVAVEVAGGVRTAQAAASVLGLGAARVVIGTAALRDASFARELVDRHGAARVAVALDVRDGVALGDAWRVGAAGEPVAAAVRSLADVGVTTFEVTAIDRDGLLGGPDLDLYARVLATSAARVIASAGVASIDDLQRLRAIGCAGAIVGRALYDGRLDLPAALAAVSAPPA